MRKPIIQTGDKFGRLTAIKFDHRDKRSNQYWIFQCDCGNKKVLCVSEIKKGHTKSCGCLRKEMMTKHGMARTRTYKSWEAMKIRCLNKSNKDYKYYGGRGITVCKEWLIFENFYKDMGDRPQGKTLDRIKNDKGYFKSNCKWSTSKEQANNRRNNLNN